MAVVGAEPAAIREAAEAFIRQEHMLLIDGGWEDSATGEKFETRDPATEELLTEVARAGSADVDAAVAAAARAVAPEAAWRRMSHAERAKLIWRLGDLIDAHAETFAVIDSLDNGKPVAHALGDARYAADLFRYMAGWSTKIEGRTLPINAIPGVGASLAYTLREPVGVTAQIIPWNFPLAMISWKMAPALAAGVTVVLKPAEQTPLSALLFGRLVLEAGFPNGVVNILTGPGDTGALLASHPRVDKVAFTGSTEVGRLIVQAAAGNLKKVSLELGGKAPCIVYADADLDLAVQGAADAALFNVGQCCTAAQRLYVEDAVYDEVVSGVVSRAASIRLGRGVDSASEMGPLISASQRDKVLGLVASGVGAGASIATGGEGAFERGYFVKPTVMLDATHDMEITREEIFGPVVCPIRFDSVTELLSVANETRYGLSAGIFTRDLERAHRTAALLRAGTVWINTYNINDPGIPFGGYKESGWGRDMGEESVEGYLETKSVLISY
jgi:phenylacetaldehyde dehydrogenase